MNGLKTLYPCNFWYSLVAVTTNKLISYNYFELNFLLVLVYIKSFNWGNKAL